MLTLLHWMHVWIKTQMYCRYFYVGSRTSWDNQLYMCRDIEKWHNNDKPTFQSCPEQHHRLTWCILKVRILAMISIYENCVWLKKEGKASKESLQSDKFWYIFVIFYTYFVIYLCYFIPECKVLKNVGVCQFVPIKELRQGSYIYRILLVWNIKGKLRSL